VAFAQHRCWQQWVGFGLTRIAAVGFASAVIVAAVIVSTPAHATPPGAKPDANLSVSSPRLPETSDDEDDEATTSWHEKTTSRAEAGREMWAGVAVMRGAHSLYSGTTLAPFGTIQQDGWRLRSGSQLTRYTYTGSRYSPVTGDTVGIEVEGVQLRLDLLAGYQWSHGALTAKAFIGMTSQRDTIAASSPDASELWIGQSRGLKSVLELWYNLTPAIWTALDVSYATPQRAYSVRARVAHSVTENSSVGVEAAALGGDGAAAMRLGTFVRYDTGVHEFAGHLGRHMPDTGRSGGYVSVQWMRRF
jgi:Cellulose biosynthesis protein BcsS